MAQDIQPVPSAVAAAIEKQRTAEEASLIKALGRLEGRKLTQQEQDLSLDQARAIGEL